MSSWQSEERNEEGPWAVARDERQQGAMATLGASEGRRGQAVRGKVTEAEVRAGRA